MILGCHRALDEAIRRHGQDAVELVDAALVKAAWDSKLAWAFQQADPETSLKVLKRAVMVPWYIEQFIGFRDGPNPSPTTVDPYLPEVDMGLLRRVIAERASVIRALSDARRAMLMSDDTVTERTFQDGLPDFSTAVCWADGTPRRMFHVTPLEFDEFKPLSHFGSAVAVSRHADKAWRYGRDHEDMRVIGATLKIVRPLRIVDDGQMSSCWLVVAAHRAGALTRADVSAIFSVADTDLDDDGSPRAGAVEAELAEVETRLVTRLLNKQVRIPHPRRGATGWGQALGAGRFPPPRPGSRSPQDLAGVRQDYGFTAWRLCANVGPR